VILRGLRRASRISQRVRGKISYLSSIDYFLLRVFVVVILACPRVFVVPQNLCTPSERGGKRKNCRTDSQVFSMRQTKTIRTHRRHTYLDAPILRSLTDYLNPLFSSAFFHTKGCPVDANGGRTPSQRNASGRGSRYHPIMVKTGRQSHHCQLSLVRLDRFGGEKMHSGHTTAAAQSSLVPAFRAFPTWACDTGDPRTAPWPWKWEWECSGWGFGVREVAGFPHMEASMPAGLCIHCLTPIAIAAQGVLSGYR
jgi:hypothetical protein